MFGKPEQVAAGKFQPDPSTSVFVCLLSLTSVFFAEDLVEVVVRPGLPGDLRAGTIPSRSRSCGPGREGPWPRTSGTAAASLIAETLTTTAAMVKKRSAANTAVSEAAVKPERASTRSNGRISTRNSAKSSPDPKVRREPFKTTLTLPNFKSVAFVVCADTRTVCVVNVGKKHIMENTFSLFH